MRAAGCRPYTMHDVYATRRGAHPLPTGDVSHASNDAVGDDGNRPVSSNMP